MLLLKLKYRFNYYWKAFWNTFDICPKCWSKGYRSPRGVFICTNGYCK